MTKRLRAAGEEEEEEEEVEILESNTNVANFLLVLPHHGRRHGPVAKSSRKQQCYAERTFECKTCYRQFPSFQALGGHCTTHKRSSKEIAGATPRPKIKPRTHECAVCGMVFSMGQALGGHMRRHKPPTTSTVDLFRSDRGSSSSSCSTDVEEEEEEERRCCSEDPKLLLLDLNLPPPEEEEEEEDRDLKLRDFFLMLGTSL